MGGKQGARTSEVWLFELSLRVQAPGRSLNIARNLIRLVRKIYSNPLVVFAGSRSKIQSSQQLAGSTVTRTVCVFHSQRGMSATSVLVGWRRNQLAGEPSNKEGTRVRPISFVGGGTGWPRYAGTVSR